MLGTGVEQLEPGLGSPGLSPVGKHIGGEQSVISLVDDLPALSVTLANHTTPISTDFVRRVTFQFRPGLRYLRRESQIGTVRRLHRQEGRSGGQALSDSGPRSARIWGRPAPGGPEVDVLPEASALRSGHACKDERGYPLRFWSGSGADHDAVAHWREQGDGLVPLPFHFRLAGRLSGYVPGELPASCPDEACGRLTWIITRGSDGG